jgi:hypothetical protein
MVIVTGGNVPGPQRLLRHQHCAPGTTGQPKRQTHLAHSLRAEAHNCCRKGWGKKKTRSSLLRPNTGLCTFSVCSYSAKEVRVEAGLRERAPFFPIISYI